MKSVLYAIAFTGLMAVSLPATEPALTVQS